MIALRSLSRILAAFYTVVPFTCEEFAKVYLKKRFQVFFLFFFGFGFSAASFASCLLL